MSASEELSEVMARAMREAIEALFEVMHHLLAAVDQLEPEPSADDPAGGSGAR
jgi:predicted DNA-binding protein